MEGTSPYPVCIYSPVCSGRRLDWMVNSRLCTSMTVLSLTRADHGMDTEMLPMKPSTTSTGALKFSNASLMDCDKQQHNTSVTLVSQCRSCVSDVTVDVTDCSLLVVVQDSRVYVTVMCQLLACFRILVTVMCIGSVMCM